MTIHDSFTVRWYGERGIVNALVTHLQAAQDPLGAVRSLLSAIRWSDASVPGWLSDVMAATIFVEWGWADFGNPDVLLVLKTSDGPRLVMIEAKIVPYLLSMKQNDGGMREGGFNSSV